MSDPDRTNPETGKTIDVSFPGIDATQATGNNAGALKAAPAVTHSSHRYEVGKVIAKGGMGAILNAREATLERVVAMKVMLNADSPESAARFVSEAKVTGQLEHPNIVPVHELGVDEKAQTYYTMKMVHGVTLRKVLEDIAKNDAETIAKYPLADLLTIFQKVCDAMAFAHSKGIIHRDLKPENIMLGDFGEVLVMDWGLAKILSERNKEAVSAQAPTAKIELRENESGTQATMEGTILGTLRYMAPEQAKGFIDQLDARSDIYALGGILYQILALRTAVDGPNANSILVKVCTGKFVPPIEVVDAKAKLPHLPGGRVPESLSAVAMKAMALDQEDRYQRVTDLQRDIAAYQKGFATSAENAGVLKQVSLLVKRNKGIFATAFAAWFVITALAVLFVMSVTHAKKLAEDERNRATANEARAVANEKRAENALADLRTAAPTLVKQARDLIDQQKFDEALEKINFAVKIEGKNAEYRLLRAQVLEVLLKFDEAAAEFRAVLALGPNDSAAENLALCEKMLRDNKGNDNILDTSLKALHELMLKERRSTQDVPIAARLGLGRVAMDARIKALFDVWRKLPGWERFPEKERYIHLEDGTVRLQINQLPVTDLSGLKGIPITNLSISYSKMVDLNSLADFRLGDFNAVSTSISDLGPLRGMRLKFIDLSGCQKVEDLSPLAGMPLEICRLSQVHATDFSPLKGAPIKELSVSETRITSLDAFAGTPCEKISATTARALVDISAVRTMRLKSADFSNSGGIADLAPLADCPDLENVSVSNEPKNLASLRTLTKLNTISVGGHISSPEELWVKLGIANDRDRERVALMQKARSALVAAGCAQQPPPVPWVKVLPDGTLDLFMCKPEFKTLEPLRGLPVSVLNIATSTVTDLSPLANMPLRQLNISRSRIADLSPLAKCRQLEILVCWENAVRDLSPLAGLPLEFLNVNEDSISSISPLAGMPLRELRLRHTAVSDLRPLLSCPTLERLVVPEGAKDVGQLRALKNLTRLSQRYDIYNTVPSYDPAGPAQTVEEFWKEYDAQKAGIGK